MNAKRCLLTISVGWAMAFAADAQTARYVVPPGTPGVIPTHPYTSWATAATNIADAVNASSTTEHDVISVTNGTYVLSTFVFINKPVTVQAFGGTAIVDGNQAERCFGLNHADAVLSGLTIRNGLTIGEGGGVRIGPEGGSVIDCIVIDNTAGSAAEGGGVYIASASGRLLGGKVLNNRCGRNGGGVYVTGGIVSNVTIAGNAATNTSGPGRLGGGVYAAGGARVTDVNISSNWTTYLGGGILLNASTLSDSTVDHNEAVLGAGIYMQGAAALVSDSIVSNNAASSGGGGIWAAAGLITGSTIRDNTAPNDGGGVYLRSAALRDSTIGPGNSTLSRGGGINVGTGAEVSNCVIVGNRSQATGGGVYFWEYGLVTHSTIVSNMAVAGPGGGAYMRHGGHLRNSLLWGNVTTNTLGGGNPLGAGGAVFSDGIGRFGGLIESCTIVGNTAYRGGGVCFQVPDVGSAWHYNSMTNCIVYGNVGTWYFTVNNIFFKATGDSKVADTNAPAYSCFTADWPTPGGRGNLVNIDPLFQDGAARNYRLDKFSPCIDQGFNRDWMRDALDLDNNPRIDRFSGAADMGAYEYVRTGTVILVR